MIAIALPRYWPASRVAAALAHVASIVGSHPVDLSTIDTDAPCVDTCPTDYALEARPAASLATPAG